MPDNDHQTRLRSNWLVKPPAKSSDADMTVAELANLMQSQLATYQRTAKEDFKKLGDSLSSLTIQMTQREVIASDIEKLREANNKSFNTLSTSINTKEGNISGYGQNRSSK